MAIRFRSAAAPDSPAYSVQLVVQAEPVRRTADWSRRQLPRQQTWIALQALRTCSMMVSAADKSSFATCPCDTMTPATRPARRRT